VLSDDAAAVMVFDDDGFVGYGVVLFSADGNFQMMIDSTENSSSMLEALLFDDNGNSTGSMMIVVVQEPDSATESKKIGEGHAYDKHVLGTNNTNGKEFEKDKDINGKKFPRDSITTKQQFVDFIKEIMDNTTVKKESTNQPGKWYYWHDETGTIVIYNPNNSDHGTCFRPTNGKTYYDNQN
jgi:filamentous hemagglutinin